MISLAREIYGRNCYKFNPGNYGTVIDLGANCGVFTMLASQFSSLVISVESDNKIMPTLFKKNIINNDIKNCIFINKYINEEKNDDRFITMSELIKLHNIQHIDFLKVDIEGWEKNIITQDSLWLKLVQNISIELHPIFGVDVKSIIDILNNFGFTVMVCDTDLNMIGDVDKYPYVYMYAKNELFIH